MGDSGWSKVASLYDGRRAVGGRLHVRDGRLLFVPHAFDRALSGRSLDMPLRSIGRVSLTRRSWTAPRRHVLVETTEGVEARFLVNGARDVIATVAEAARAAGAEPVVSDD